MSTQHPHYQPPAEPSKIDFVKKLLRQTAHDLTQPETYTLDHAKVLLQRGKRAAGLAKSVVMGVSYTHRIKDRPTSNEQVSHYLQLVCQQACRALQVEVIPLKPIPQELALWTCNHISWLDIAVVGSIIPTFFISKAEIADWPIMGKVTQAAKTLYIKRGSGDSGYVSRLMAQDLEAGKPLIFFPEATTSDGTGILPLHGKLLQSAMDTQTPIQPILITYVNADGKLDDMIPYTDMTMAESIQRIVDNRPSKAYILPLDKIEPADHTRDELTAMLQAAMIDGLQRMHAQVLS